MRKRILLGGMIIMTFLMMGCFSKSQDLQKEKLAYAITSSNLQGVKEVVRSGEAIDFSDLGYYEITPYAFRDGKPQKDGRALALALEDSDDAVAGALLEAGAPASDPEDAYTYLREAICNHSLELCKQLIEHGADVNGGKETPLEALISFVHPGMEDAQERARLLIDHGARIDQGLMKSCMKNCWRYVYAKQLLNWFNDQGKESGLESGLEAAITGDDQKLQELVKHGAIKNRDEVLFFAAASCNTETLQQMKAAGYDFSTKDDFGMGLLHIGALCNTKAVVSYFLESGLDGNEGSENGYQPITYAAIGGKKDVLRLLLDRGYTWQQDEDSDEEDTGPVWTWCEACDYGSARSVDSMLSLGYQPTKWDCAVGYGGSTDDVFHELIKRKLPYTYDLSWDGDRIVDDATEKRTEELVRLGAKVSSKTLCQAITWRNHDLLRTLLDKGIKLGTTEDDSPLICAIRSGDLESVQCLVEAGADVNQQIETEEDGTITPMHAAAESASADILKYLIDQGGNIKKKDSNGKTPYDYATSDEWENTLSENAALLI